MDRYFKLARHLLIALFALMFLDSKTAMAKEESDSDVLAELESLPSIQDARTKLSNHARGTPGYAGVLHEISQLVSQYLIFDPKYLNQPQAQFIDEILKQLEPDTKAQLFTSAFLGALQEQRYAVAQSLLHRAVTAAPDRMRKEACAAAKQFPIDYMSTYLRDRSALTTPEEMQEEKEKIEYIAAYRRIISTELGSLPGVEKVMCDVFDASGKKTNVSLKALLNTAAQASSVSGQTPSAPVVPLPSQCTESQAERLLAQAIFRVTPGFGYAFRIEDGACSIGGLMRLEGQVVVFYVNRFIAYSGFAEIRGKDSEAMFAEYRKWYSLAPSPSRLDYVTLPGLQSRSKVVSKTQ